MAQMAMGTGRTSLRGFWVGAIASTLWMAFGCVMYLVEVTMDPAAVAPDMRAMMAAIPDWMWGAFAVSVWVGLAGALLLLARRRLAVLLIGISVIAQAVQNSAYFLDPELSAATAPAALLMPVIILVITFGVFWFARSADRRGILR